MNRYLGILLCVTFLIAGCGGEPDLSPEAKAKKEARKAAQEAYAAQQAQKEEEAKKPPKNHVPQVVKTEEAHAGVGAKGHYGNEPMMQPVTTAMSAYWSIQESNMFQQVTYAIKLFHASNGRFPKDQKEFDQRIIKENHLRLPELPDGKRYHYDSQTGTLMVETLR